MPFKLHRLAFLLIVVSTTSSYAQEAVRALIPKKHFATLDKYCLECHDTLSEERGIDLETLSFELNTVESAETWQKVLNAMNSREMPPENKKQLSFEEKSVLLADLSRELVVAREVFNDTGGAITMRRLNRREYENTVEDLLGIRIEADALPNDASSGGFDTDGCALFFSGSQFEQHLARARKALSTALVVGDRPEFRTLQHESEVEINAAMLKLAEELQAKHELALEWRANAETKSPSDYGFIDKNNVKVSEVVYSRRYDDTLKYLARKESKTGLVMVILQRGPKVDRLSFPGWPPGEYRSTVRAGYLPESLPHERFLEYGVPPSGAMTLLGCVEIKGTFEDPHEVTIPTTFESNGNREFMFR